MYFNTKEALETIEAIKDESVELEYLFILTEWFDKATGSYVSLWGTGETDLILKTETLFSMKAETARKFDLKVHSTSFVGYFGEFGAKGFDGHDYVAKKLEKMGTSYEPKPLQALACSKGYFCMALGNVWKIRQCLTKATLDKFNVGQPTASSDLATKEYLYQIALFYSSDPKVEAWYNSALITGVSKIYNKDIAKVIMRVKNDKQLAEASVA